MFAFSLPPQTRVFARLALPLYCVGLAWITLAPASDAGQVTGIVGWAATAVAATGLMTSVDAYDALEFIANIALFVPLGALLRLAFPKLRWWQIVAIGFATSLAIELAQLALPSRFSTVSDLVANTLGAAGGSRLRLSTVSPRKGDHTTCQRTNSASGSR